MYFVRDNYLSVDLDSAEVRQPAVLREGEADEGKVEAGKSGVRGGRLRVRLPNVVVVDVKVGRVRRRRHLGDVGRCLVRHRLPVDVGEPGIKILVSIKHLLQSVK